MGGGEAEKQAGGKLGGPMMRATQPVALSALHIAHLFLSPNCSGLVTFLDLD